MRRSHLRLWAALAALISASPAPLFSQEQLGLRLERYAGIWGAGLNPSQTAFNPNRWEVNLCAADLFFENSYAYLRSTSLPNALRNTDKILAVSDLTPERPPAAGAIVQDFYDAQRRMHAVVQARATGPGFSFRLGENHVLGLVTSARAMFSAYQIPEVLAYHTISDLPLNQRTEIAPTALRAMIWGEIGLHYSHLDTDGDIHQAWGITPRLLLGTEGFFTEAESNFDYTDRRGDTTDFGRARWDYALTTGNLTEDAAARRLRVQGRGIGLDLGYSWASPADNGDGYAWRLGLSLLDFGFVRFNNSAERHRIEVEGVVTVRDDDFPTRSDPRDHLRDVSQAFLGDPAKSLQTSAFSMGLPTALSVQYDVQVAPLMYVGAVLTQRVPMMPNSLRRPSTLAVVPRFEHRWASVSFPVVLNDWRSLRMGLAARFGFLAFGTDNLNSFFTKEKLSGTDVYVGLKINGFSLHFKEKERAYKGRKSSGGRSKQQRRKIKCYEF